MRSPNLDGFARRGGRLIVAHGAADPVFSLQDTLDWWGEVHTRYGDRTDGIVRVFPVPGMAHCGGGPATDGFDMLSALVDWVEQGKAPSTLTARATPAPFAGPDWPRGSRLLCAWPKLSRYHSGDPQSASSYVCE